MARVDFLLNGAPVSVDVAPTVTLLDWLRDTRRLTGTKEGCNEGDCGACTVSVASLDDGRVIHRALNACILFLPQVQGRAVRTVEGLAAPGGALHPVQQAMVDHHGSQCGFCTPGIVMSLYAAARAGRADHDDVLAGNLCRCTGYGPVVRAAEAAAAEPAPWLADAVTGEGAAMAALPAGDAAMAPEDLDAFADWYAANPDAVLVAGATDVGLWVTKQMRDLGQVVFLNRLAALQRIESGPEGITIGSGVTLSRLRGYMAGRFPAFAELIRRYGSVQVRNAATIGGNIANGSPIGDCPPPLIALGARLVLRRGGVRRVLPLEDFFLAYGRQDRQPGEFVESVVVPPQPNRLRVWKVSKRFDQDISALCGAFCVSVEDGRVVAARIAFGGMAATPKRALAVEAAITGQPWTQAAVRAAMPAFADDFRPISDMRASAAYRLRVARNLLLRAWAEDQGQRVSLAQRVAV
jgi:xanthine dehydrogenase small subunit